MKRISLVVPALSFALAVLGMLVTDATPAAAQTFSYKPAGELVKGSGRGRVDNTVYVPGMRFPLEKGPAFANSQVYGRGGMYGGGGGQCDSANYSYPWRDNYCETRSWSVPMCPGGKGHQGQDIRPATCKKGVHKAVAAVDGTITSISGYVVYLRASDGTNHRYMHMSNVAVKAGQKVKRGQLMGYVSNYMGTTPTTIHLHYDIQRNGQFIPPYMSLVRSYEALIGAPTQPTTPKPDPKPTPPPPVPGGCVPTAAAGASNALFKDFPPSQTGYPEAEILYRANITTGCQTTPLMFCPNCKMSRRHMAIFLVRAAKLPTSNPPKTATFSDVPVGSSGFAEIEAAYKAGITTGCSAGKFCPDNIINRAQAAAMVRRARNWPQISPTKATFKDVSTSAGHYRDIETIADRCVTRGCGDGNFCPNNELTRAHGAVFIARAFNLNNINPCADRPTLKGATAIPVTGDFPEEDENDNSLGTIEDAETQEHPDDGGEEQNSGESISPDEIYTGVDADDDSDETDNKSDSASATGTGAACSATGVAGNGFTGGGTFAGLTLLGLGLMIVRKRGMRG